MKPPSRIALRLAATAHRTKAARPLPLAARSIHSTPPAPATVSSIHGNGPPPDPPQPAADSEKARVERRKKQAELLQKAKDIRAGASSTSTKSTSSAAASASTTPPTPTATATSTTSTATTKDGSSSSGGDGAGAAAAAENRRSALARKRFWRDVHVREVDGALEVHLDARPLRHPATKRVVRLPPSKPVLAGAVALEWDLLVSAQAATRQHLIPLTSLVCRALDIREDDEAWAGRGVVGGVQMGGGNVSVSLRRGIVEMVMRYLDTDTLLCWAPPYRDGIDDPITAGEGEGEGEGEEQGGFDIHDPASSTRGKSLRDAQRRAAGSVVGFLTSRVWPGIAIEPVLDGESIMPRQQPPGTRQVVEGWVAGLDAWELAGLERAVLAGKGLLGAARLLVEWSEGGGGVGRDGAVGEESLGKKKFGIEEATRLANIEVDYQIGRWGEVEDTHDVEREDLRRQFGSVVLLVSGLGSR
ncbi:ATP synthase mitochondrial F1 complex assembly factor 2 [Diatrype stigma]|uniref:ATP synthase mitochondrial F1 complex assembly factor 2 n=1 Tax=Diatrype stigma TaxID=117547 RepID=A0AAN9UY76_9PEZI